MRRGAACGLFLLLFGSLRCTLSHPNLSDPSHVAAHRDGGWVTRWGRVVGEPDVRDTYTNLRLVVDRLQIEDQEHAIEGKILVRAPCYPRHVYGDELEVEEKPARAWIQICWDQSGDRPAVSMDGDTLQSVVFDQSKTNEAQPRSGLVRTK